MLGKRTYPYHTERVHSSADGDLVRDLMLGFNDGVVASFAITAGVGGAAITRAGVIAAGLAETIGGALSMGLAAFASARSETELYRSEMEREAEEIRRWPDRERQEIRAIYHSKGFRGELLDAIIDHVTADPERWRDVMMREELGFTTSSFPDPRRAAMAVGGAFFVGAAIPLLPYLVLADSPVAPLVSAVTATCALFAGGVAKSIFTGRRGYAADSKTPL